MSFAMYYYYNYKNLRRFEAGANRDRPSCLSKLSTLPFAPPPALLRISSKSMGPLSLRLPPPTPPSPFPSFFSFSFLAFSRCISKSDCGRADCAYFDMRSPNCWSRRGFATLMIEGSLPPVSCPLSPLLPLLVLSVTEEGNEGPSALSMTLFRSAAAF